jgi:tetratricopeptide (TPR) repeat protein
MRRALVLAALTAALTACSSTESAKKDDRSTYEPAPAADGTGDAPPAPAAEAPAADAPPPEKAAADGSSVETVRDEKEAEKVVAQMDKQAAKQGLNRSEDGIDDDNPLPKDGSASRQAFDAAVDRARTDPAGAVSMFVDAANKTTYFYAAYFNAGAAAERSGNDASAERYYRDALRIRPDYGPALTNLYLLLLRKGNAAGADKVIDDALRKRPDFAGPHIAAAVRAYRKKDLKTVEAEALKAVRIDERAVPAMRLMAQVFFEQGRYETAKFALENALTLEPGNALLRLQLGHVLLRLDEEKKALLEYGKAVQLRPELAEAQESYAILLKRSGDADRALTAFQKTAELRPKSAMAQLNLGNGLRAKKKYVEAEAAYTKALQLDPNLHAVHFNLGIMYMDNEIEGRDELEMLNKAKEELTKFSEGATPDKEMKQRIAIYQTNLDKRARRIEKRRKREERRRLIREVEEEEARKKAEAEAAAAKGGGEAKPAEGGEAKPAEGGEAKPAEGGEAKPAEGGGDAKPAAGGDK